MPLLDQLPGQTAYADRIEVIERFPTPFLFLFWQITESRAAHACISAARRLPNASCDRISGPSFTTRDLAVGTVTQSPSKRILQTVFRDPPFRRRDKERKSMLRPVACRAACIEHRRPGILPHVEPHVERLAEFLRVLTGPLEFEGREKPYFGEAG
ncbi:hypothetical protein PG985_015139 [Apiospora marii]|uniref:Uncharacterized protein n=1 Tax=Apiospora marii TaxID=335849 RepID=A0ABR1RLU8_9PEZI